MEALRKSPAAQDMLAKVLALLSDEAAILAGEDPAPPTPRISAASTAEADHAMDESSDAARQPDQEKVFTRADMEREVTRREGARRHAEQWHNVTKNPTDEARLRVEAATDASEHRRTGRDKDRSRTPQKDREGPNIAPNAD
jgi:hypothetical protein